MLDTFRRAFQIQDIRRKILYTFLMLVVIRIGSQLPTPGVNAEFIQNFFAQNTGEAFNLFNAFTGVPLNRCRYLHLVSRRISRLLLSCSF